MTDPTMLPEFVSNRDGGWRDFRHAVAGVYAKVSFVDVPGKAPNIVIVDIDTEAWNENGNAANVNGGQGDGLCSEIVIRIDGKSLSAIIAEATADLTDVDGYDGYASYGQAVDRIIKALPT